MKFFLVLFLPEKMYYMAAKALKDILWQYNSSDIKEFKFTISENLGDDGLPNYYYYYLGKEKST